MGSSKRQTAVKASSLLAAAGASTALAFLFLAGTPGMRSPAAAATAPPTPPPISAPATPPASPVSAPGTPGPAASVIPLPGQTPAAAAASGKARPSPPPNARKGVDGVWEVEIQHPTSTDYTHFAITQQGDAVTGTYLDAKGKKYPVAGSVDGQSIRLIVTMPNGSTLLLEGKLDGTTDMVGMITTPDGQVPFTAAYRARQNWIENVNPSPGGIPSQGGYTPP